MDGKYFKPDSNFLLKKCGRKCDGGVDRAITQLPDEIGIDRISDEIGANRINDLPDEIGVSRISELPDEIVVAILSFLPLRQAVTASLISSRWLNLWKRTPNLKSDRISQLPDEIVVIILSFLSLREAVATSVLSSRWSSMWKRTPNLNFNTKLLKINPWISVPMYGTTWDVERHKYIEIVNSVLQSHKATSLKEFRISLHINRSAQCALAEWLEFVFSRQVERLELDLVCDESRYMVVLEELLRDSKVNVCLPQNLIAFKSLKSLCLKCFKVSGVAIDLFLRNCPLLEHLFIHGAVLTSDIVVCGTTRALKHFDLYCCIGQYSINGEHSIKVSAPNLTWLRIDATEQKLLLEKIPKLIRADYTCTSPSPDYAKHFASAVFGCSSQLEILNLILLYPKVFLANTFPRLPELKKLVVRYNGVFGHGLLPVTALMWASPRLEEFEFEFMSMPKDLTTWGEGTTDAKRPCHEHLKVFEFKGFFVGADDHMELLTYIIANCAALEKIIVFCSPICARVYDIRGDLRAVRGRVKRLLRGKVPEHIQLHVV